MIDKIGEKAYYVKGDEIKSDMISECLVRTQLNTGDDRQGKLLKPIIKFRFYNDNSNHWFPKNQVFFSKEELFKSIK